MKAPGSASEAVAQFKPFVVQTAIQFESGSIARDDLIQEGLMAVCTAFNSWRPDGGANFLTWIRRPVKLAMLAWVRKQKKAGGSFRGGRRSRKGEGVSLVSMDSANIHVLPESFRHGLVEALSLHELIGESPDMRDALALQRLPGLFLFLEERERKVLRLRFGEGMTHAQVGKRMRISRSLARHIEQTAIARLKALMTDSEGVES